MPARALPWLLLLALLSCSHDIDALRSERGASPGLREDAGGTGGGSGGGGSGSGGSGAGGSGGSASSDAGPNVMGPGPCEPCESLTEAAMSLDLQSCCRGIGNTQCGIAFPQSEFCLPRFVQGTLDDACPDFNQGEMQLDGCCRPDTRCGLDAQALGLGCAAREELLPEVDQGGDSEMIPCLYPCGVDEDCNVLPGGFVCAEDLSHAERHCARECKNDRDCAGTNVCALGNDLGMDRVLATCQPAVGSAAPGESCMRAEDCMHGVCIGTAGTTGVCSNLCRLDGECPEDRPFCADTTILTIETRTEQMFRICRAR
jgi:hypothetical protein